MIIILEIIKVVIIGIVAAYMWTGRKEIGDKGWSYGLAGFAIILFGEIIKAAGIKDSQELFLSRAELEVILERIYILGFFLLAVGIYKWLPGAAEKKGELGSLQEKYVDTVEALCRLQKAVETTHIGITITDTQGKVIYINPAEAKMHGYTVEELYGSDAKIFAPQERWCTTTVEDLKKIKQYKRETINIRKDGTIFPVQLISNVVANSLGDPIGIITACEDISERKNFERAMEESRVFLQSVIDGVTEPFLVIGKDHRVLLMNRTVREGISGHNPASEHLCYNVIFNRAMPCERLCPLELVQDSGEPITVMYDDCRINGEGRCIEVLASPLFNNEGAFTGIVESSRDITDRKRAEETIKHMVYYDELTGLPNRMLFNDRLTLALYDSRRYEKMLAVMFLDLDRFKNINDTMGHHIGDLLLKAVAERLTETLRDLDTVSRHGGDEFTVLLSNIYHPQEAAKVALKVIKAVSGAFIIEGREIIITTSIGISIYPSDGADADTLLRNADIAMYAAKEHGRNSYQFYSPAMNAVAFERLTLENSLRKAVERREFILHYQPMVNIKTGRIIGMEALVRWQHPDLGLIYPSQFIALAEETGLIVPIGEMVLREACRQNRLWKDEGFPPLRLGVNLSARQFQQQNIMKTVDRILKDTGVEPAFLDLEITESIIMQSMEGATHTLRELHNMGVGISIDDFGTGYSSLSYLKGLPADHIKIDRSFICDLTENQDSAAIAAAIIAMTHSLNRKVIAEGVETEEQLSFLRLHQCDEMQGNLFCRPLPVEEFTAFLGNGNILRVESV